MNDNIADRLDGVKRGNLQLDLFERELWLTIRNKHHGIDIFVDGNVSPSDLLAFCRAVVERVDGGKTERFRLILEKCDRELTLLGADPNEGLRKEVEDALGYT